MGEIQPPQELGRWSLGYIDDAATARFTLVSPRGTVFEDVSNYEPLEGSGVHLCGQSDDGKQPTTVANYPMRSKVEARFLWELARSVAECASRDEEDFLVDLILPDGIVDDFSSNRQLWPRAIEAWNFAHSPVAMVDAPNPASNLQTKTGVGND